MSGLFNDEHKARKYIEENDGNDKMIFNVVAECMKRTERLGAVGMLVLVQTDNGIIASSAVNKHKVNDFDAESLKQTFSGLIKEAEDENEKHKKKQTERKPLSGVNRKGFELYAQEKLGDKLGKEIMSWADEAEIFDEDGSPNIEAVKKMYRKMLGDDDE